MGKSEEYMKGRTEGIEELGMNLKIRWNREERNGR